MLGLDKSHLYNHWQIFVKPGGTRNYRDARVTFPLSPSCEVVGPFPFISPDTTREWELTEQVFTRRAQWSSNPTLR